MKTTTSDQHILSIIGEVNEPYVSMNKLAEYMQANATRRRQIIKNLKEDKEYKKVYYAPVKNIISEYFISKYDNIAIKSAINQVEKKKGTTAWHEIDNPNSILALQNLMDASKPDMTEYQIIHGIKLSEVMLGGLKVIIKPDVFLQHTQTGKIGAVKIHLAKTEKNQLDMLGRQYAATIIKHGLLTLGFQESKVDNNACISLDIFQKSFSNAPKAYKRTLDALTACCEEIVARWPTL